jgi:hypothetical protein
MLDRFFKKNSCSLSKKYVANEIAQNNFEFFKRRMLIYEI